MKLLVPLEFMRNFINAFEGRNLTIPCRLTHPLAQANLVKANPRETVPLGPRFTYDSKTGFAVTLVTSYFSGLFLCQAVLGNKTTEESVILIFKRKFCIFVFAKVELFVLLYHILNSETSNLS